jgi:2,3-dihydroxybiphenyl 1,2-dioxygenase
MVVTQLGYIGYQVSDRDAWRRLATEIIGFEVAESGDSPMYLRIDERHHRLALYPGTTDKLDYIGWEAPNLGGLAEIAARVKAAGIEVATGTEAECAVRKVKRFVKFRDPNGFPVEVYTGPERGTRPFLPSRPNSGFKTGALGLGHVVLRCADPDASVRFYCEALGMRVTDTAELPRMSATFLHCNARHHSLALTTALHGAAGQVSHIMVEACSMEDVGCAYELCQAKGVPIWLSLGQHTNDRVLSFYIRSPSGFGLEYGFGGLEIDDATWCVEHWKSGSFWGHKPAA